MRSPHCLGAFWTSVSVRTGRSTQARSARLRRIVVVAVALAWWVVLAAAPLHAQCTNDLQGPDDEPGQKDLSQFCLLGTCNAGFSVSWNFDDTDWSGSNTGDGCALFDTDGDGNANRAVCVTIESPAQMQAGNPKCYTCGHTRPDNCPSSVLVACTSSCQVTSATDPLQFAPNHPVSGCNGTECRTTDTQTPCCLTANDAGLGGVLIDTCSYPSQQTTSDASDSSGT